MEDRRNNEAQFDLAYADIDGEEILTAFDSCSNTTLTIKNKDKERYEKLKYESAEEVERVKGYESAIADNFQLVPGGKIQLLLGLDVGNDFFPKEISTFRSGLKVSEHRMKLSDPTQFLGFSGSFPAHFIPMYSQENHPRALLMQENPQVLQEEEKSVFRVPASAQKKR